MEIRFDITGAPCQSGVDPELFFPDSMDHAKIKEAKAVCKECPVTLECLTFAIKTRSEGIWGGLTTNERQNYRRRMERVNAHQQKASELN
jgi:WhiB family redox-sensing transcriptional regulator